MLSLFQTAQGSWHIPSILMASSWLIGSLVTGFFIVANLRVNRNDRLKAHRKESAATAKAAALESSLADTQIKLSAAEKDARGAHDLARKLDLVAQQRRLTEEQKTRFKDAMRGKQAGPIRVMSISTNNEVKDFVNQLRALLDDNGCQLPPNSLVRIVMGDVSISNHPEGTALLVRSQARSPGYAGDVQKAFESIGIPMPGIEVSTEQNVVLDGEVVIFVSERR